ncbi:baseplate assembly protein [Acidomonas methanolica]|uniref:Phage related baseplate assembly protein n=1 Tax=Acidomonas methanolica NBRC 104435 TaxID=1231351 RepID=A0A023D2H7_ACIMT|nr:baseplate assembly protein [Acidomonas methanolica]TCS29299.1 hypothetical protein EDC31_10771 [Acidomonas methanolica]GAJ28016.1 phage related baseplate assembly protein [Acidomonas methanolica NBRC 104435]GBQ54563.1 phage-related baseplate assembly protein [Acidomonas methanolica]GEK99320.1 hypothetical protein AME01nite_18190 [Acidomonas methanolica NBRC 104435]
MSEARFVAAAMANRVAHTVHGIVSAVDPVNHAVKVRVQPENVETGWIADAAFAQAGDLRIACPSAVGTHVVLQPLEGDGEHFVLAGVVYDTVMAAPVSPWTGAVAQPGEILVMAGCGAPPAAGSAEESAGEATPGAGWLHVTAGGVFLGAGGTRVAVSASGLACVAGAASLTFDSSGLVVSGGDVRTDLHSLNGHVHPLGGQVTGGPQG